MNLCVFYFHNLIEKLTVSFHLQEFNFHNMTVTSYRRAVFSSQLKSKVGNILAKTAELRITVSLNMKIEKTGFRV